MAFLYETKQPVLENVVFISRVHTSLGNPSKDRQRFVDAVVLISAPDRSVKLSNFENPLERPSEFGLRMLGFAKLLLYMVTKDKKDCFTFQQHLRLYLLLNFQSKRSTDPQGGLPIKSDGGQNVGPYPLS